MRSTTNTLKNCFNVIIENCKLMTKYSKNNKKTPHLMCEDFGFGCHVSFSDDYIFEGGSFNLSLQTKSMSLKEVVNSGVSVTSQIYPQLYPQIYAGDR